MFSIIFLAPALVLGLDFHFFGYLNSFLDQNILFGTLDKFRFSLFFFPLMGCLAGLSAFFLPFALGLQLMATSKSNNFHPVIPALPLIADANQGLCLLSQFTSA